jgi:6-phosphogluconolactonase
MRHGALVGLLFLLSSIMQPSFAEESSVWIGMSKPPHGERQGIYRATLNTESGDLAPPELAAEIGSPEFLALSPNGDRLYATCELARGKPGVAAFEVSADRKSLRFMNAEPINDGGACHLATDRTGRCLFTANYGSGSVAVFPLAADGQVRPRSQLVKHTGTGPDKERQEAPHPHWVGTDPENRFLLVPDLGTDRIAIYEMDVANGTLKQHGSGTCPGGSGPRHLAFHPNGRFAYVVNEMGISVTLFSWDAKAGTLTAIETVDMLPNEAHNPSWTAAEICIHPSGKFLYASTRGHDSVSAFRVDPETGRLTFIADESVRGAHPRSFTLDPAGKWLLAAGRDSNTIAAFRISAESGELQFTNTIVKSPAPICVLVQPIP